VFASRQGRSPARHYWRHFDRGPCCLSPRFHGSRGFPDDKYSLVVGLLVGGENEKAFPVGGISIGHPVHDFSVQEVHPYLQTGIIEFEVTHGEVRVSLVVLLSFEGLDKEDSLDDGGGDLDDLFRIVDSGDVEDIFVRGEIESAALYNLSVSKMDNNLVLHHPGILLSQGSRLEAVLCIFGS